MSDQLGSGLRVNSHPTPLSISFGIRTVVGGRLLSDRSDGLFFDRLANSDHFGVRSVVVLRRCLLFVSLRTNFSTINLFLFFLIIIFSTVPESLHYLVSRKRTQSVAKWFKCANKFARYSNTDRIDSDEIQPFLDHMEHEVKSCQEHDHDKTNR